MDFRFEEVRAVVFKLSNGLERMESPVKLSINYRSHNGNLNCAAGILHKLFALFPESAKILEPDKGLFMGPLPAYWLASRRNSSQLHEVLPTVLSERLVLICPDEGREDLASLCPEGLV